MEVEMTEGYRQRPSQEELYLFSDRIGRRLAEAGTGMEPLEHRLRVADLLRILGGATCYQLLGLSPAASLAEIHEAYDRNGRLVHPQNAAALGLSGREGVLEVLFEGITHAYLTLSSLERRRSYDKELGHQLWSEASADSGREDEVRQVARRYYERALDRADAQDFFVAIELVGQAVRLDPRGEYHALLGRLQAKNPRWLRNAAENLRRAMELDVADPDLPAALAQVNERLRGGEAVADTATVAARPPSRRRSGGEVPEIEIEEAEPAKSVLERRYRWK
jgi:curved DNA-binding protein CbpA